MLDELVSRVVLIPPEDVIMWSGAGMSIAPPTCLPAGPALTRRVFDSLFEPEALSIVLGYHKVLGWSSPPFCDLVNVNRGHDERRIGSQTSPRRNHREYFDSGVVGP